MSSEPYVAVLGCGGWGKNIVRTLAGLGRLRAVTEGQGVPRVESKHHA